MTQTLHQNDIEHLVEDRICDLYTTARELRQSRQGTVRQAGLVLRTRMTVGRRLVSLGHTVAGQGA